MLLSLCQRKLDRSSGNIEKERNYCWAGLPAHFSISWPSTGTWKPKKSRKSPFTILYAHTTRPVNLSPKYEQTLLGQGQHFGSVCLPQEEIVPKVCLCLLQGTDLQVRDFSTGSAILLKSHSYTVCPRSIVLIHKS